MLEEPLPNGDTTERNKQLVSPNDMMCFHYQRSHFSAVSNKTISALFGINEAIPVQFNKTRSVLQPNFIKEINQANWQNSGNIIHVTAERKVITRQFIYGSFTVVVFRLFFLQEQSEKYFVIIYCIEAATKIIANGFLLRKDAYLRNGWNMLDFVVVVVG